MYKLLIIGILLLVGCDGIRLDRPEDFKCNSEQLKLVEEEYRVCSQSGYLDSYCFLQAKVTLCERVGNIGDK
jgi:hypothetical protein